jgi:hypothetical protein
MTEPLVNTSIKGFRQIKGAPASSARYTPKYTDWGAKQTAPNANNQKLFKVKDNIISPLKQMGIDPQYQIALPCREVNDLSNKRINRGRGVPFDRQLQKGKPFTGMSKIAFSPEMRIGTIGADLKQRPFYFSSFDMCP